MSEAGRTLMFRSTDNGIQLTWNGQMVDAKFDGKHYGWTNDPTMGTSSFKMISTTQLEETDYMLGKISDVTTYTVSADGKRISALDWDKRHGTKTSSVLEKQP